jgi:hypothetical protein
VPSVPEDRRANVPRFVCKAPCTDRLTVSRKTTAAQASSLPSAIERDREHLPSLDINEKGEFGLEHSMAADACKSQDETCPTTTTLDNVCTVKPRKIRRD